MLVYKYRGGSDKILERDIESLEQNSFWSSSIDKLNDPWETIVKSDKFNTQSKSIGFFLNSKRKNALAKVEGALMNLLKTLKKAGIYSLAGNYLDEILWAHYGNGHKGFCIEYELNDLLSNYSGSKLFSFPVKYSKKPPEINFADIPGNNESLIEKLASYKSLRWNYEEEYRVVTNFSGKYYYDYKALKAIYFGLRMEDKFKDSIMKKLKGRGVKYYQIVQVDKSYKLKKESVTDPYLDEPKYLTQIPKNITQKQVVNFEIVKKSYAEIIKRGDLEVLLSNKISKNELAEFSKYLKTNLFVNAGNFFIRYYLKREDVFGAAYGVYNEINGKIDCHINEIVN
ncbi:hypothetical protein GGR42_002528 [Saonia flava]|uniref:DUF2971 domain-containing protein n=1 Tax=Saonia flava TaxID=523696 RepID=A0A846QXW8_9FLAO|nr:DUF2971 domain-containing protein [Saonia flava]NJB72037.1 hypothetical protein [Saonia flava]